MRLAHGDAAVRDLIARRVPLLRVRDQRACSTTTTSNTTEGQLAALDEAAPIIAQDQGRRACAQVYAVNLDRWLGLMDEEFDPGPGADARRGHLPGRDVPGREDSQARRPGPDDAQETGNGHHGPFGKNQESPYDLA